MVRVREVILENQEVIFQYLVVNLQTQNCYLVTSRISTPDRSKSRTIRKGFSYFDLGSSQAS